jgi:23S rRNA pseudouridine1911/1915/1917 synthase
MPSIDAAGHPPIPILHEDDALLFVDKPAGMIVQRAYDAVEPVLLDLVGNYLAPRGQAAILMQRLDRGTTGVIFFSKLPAINSNLTRQFESKRITKTYLALCEGALYEAETIAAPLRRTGPISFGVRPDGKPAATSIQPVAASPGGSLLRVELHSGRTHQIRVHLAAIGHPLVGDWLYGRRNASRPMLHAAELSMRHPLTGEPLRVAAPPPEDLVAEARQRGIGLQVAGCKLQG